MEHNREESAVQRIEHSVSAEERSERE